MKRVVTVELNGMSFNLDEDAYDLVHAYLRRAEAQLASDPGRAEVIADLERSIAEKCQPFLSAHKNVITAEEMRSVLDQIGTVGDDAGPSSANTSSQHESTVGGDDPPLVQVREGAMVSGVCNGLAVRYGIDVTIIRVLFVLLALLTSGAFVLVYIAMMFIIPYDTNIERLNDQSLPGFMFKFVTCTKRKLAGTG